MRRRSVIIAGLAGLLLAPERSTAQQPRSKIPRVGILSVADSERAPIFDAFREGLRDLGYVEGRNIILEFRLARGNLSLGPQLAARNGRWSRYTTRSRPSRWCKSGLSLLNRRAAHIHSSPSRQTLEEASSKGMIP